MLKNKAHVELDGTPYRVAENVEQHYVHEWTTPIVNRVDITGAPGKQQLFGDRLLWSFDDWSGGEGNNVYYDDEPTRYNWGTGLNPRIRGKLSGGPELQEVEALDVLDCREPVVATVAGGTLFVMGGGSATNQKLFSTTDGLTWTTDNYAHGLGITPNATAATGDFEYVYFAFYDKGSNNHLVYRRVVDLSNYAIGSPTQVVAPQGTQPIVGMVLQNAALYTWDGRTLREHDVTALPDPGTMRDNTGSAIATASADEFGSEWFGDMVASDEGLIYFVSSGTRSQVRDYTNGAAGPFWNVPRGFTVRDIAFSNGTLWVVGHWGTTADPGKGQLWAIPTSSRVPTLVHEFRTSVASSYLKPVAISPSYRNQLFIGCEDGEQFIYDVASDGMSHFHTLTTANGVTFDADNQLWEVITFGKRRYTFVAAPGAAGATTEDIQGIVYNDDDSVGSWTNQTVDTGDWDFNFPHHVKKLMGFYVSYEPMVTNQSITIHYSLDSGANYTALTAITSATTGNSQGRVFIPISTPSTDINFYKLRWRIEAESSSGGTDSPTIYSVTAEARLVSTVQRWKLALLLTDEANDQRASTADRKGHELRTTLYATKEAGDVVTFRDGYRYGGKINQTTYNVVIKDVSDTIINNGQGYAMVELEEAPS